MRAIPDLLSEHAFFGDMESEHLAVIAGCATNVHFRADQHVLTEGGAADEFYVLQSGRMAIEVDVPHGGPLVIETLGPSHVVGVSWLLPPYTWTFDARAVEATSAVAIDGACLRGKIDGDPLLGYELYRRFAGLFHERLHAARLQLLDLYQHETGGSGR